MADTAACAAQAADALARLEGEAAKQCAATLLLHSDEIARLRAALALRGLEVEFRKYICTYARARTHTHTYTYIYTYV